MEIYMCIYGNLYVYQSIDLSTYFDGLYAIDGVYAVNYRHVMIIKQ